MTDYFVGEIRMFAMGFAPRGWAWCNGQAVAINQNQAVYALLGANFGPVTQTTFSLPDLRGRFPVQSGPNYPLGHPGGAETVALTLDQTPEHLHTVNVSTQGTPATNAASPLGNTLGVVTANKAGTSVPFPVYGPSPSTFTSTTVTPLEPGSIGTIGGAAHPNLQPYTAINFCIAMTGIYPPRN